MECFMCKSASNTSGKEHCTLILSSMKKMIEEIKWFDIEFNWIAGKIGRKSRQSQLWRGDKETF